VVLAEREGEQSSVGMGYLHGLCLGCARAETVEETPVHARGVQALLAEGAGSVGERERHHDELAGLDVANLGADVFDDADRLVAHRPPRLCRLQRAVRP
jgi:hypothetical protein